LSWVELEHAEADVPGLEQVYVLYVLYTSPPEQNASPMYPDVPHCESELQVIVGVIQTPAEHV
jgi:hypothetical protein